MSIRQFSDSFLLCNSVLGVNACNIFTIYNMSVHKAEVVSIPTVQMFLFQNYWQDSKLLLSGESVSSYYIRDYWCSVIQN
jgi:hypothetical protein